MKTLIPRPGDSAMLGILICTLLMASNLSAQSVLDVIHEHREIEIFANAIEKAGLSADFNSDGPYTIFAPQNQALDEIEDRLNRYSTSSLRRFILNHVFTGMATKRQIKAMSKAPSLGGLVLQVDVDDQDNLLVNDVSVVKYNIMSRNGVIHIIDGTLE